MGEINYEKEYNNRAKVPEHEAIMQDWARDAAAFRHDHPHAELNLAYGPSARQVLDLFWPDETRAAPLAIFIHGGYWQALDKNWVSHCARGLVGQGVAVAVPSYDLCPTVKVADIVDQLREAALFVMRRHGRGAVACGHSAGGHLAAMLLATNWASRGLPASAIGAATAISGLFDLVPLVGTSINDKLGLDKAEARRLSPVHLPGPAGPLTALVGGLEGAEYARQSTDIARAWGGDYDILAGQHHFDIMAPLSDPASRMVVALAESARRARA